LPPDQLPTEVGKRFYTDYKAKHKEEPIGWAMYAYQATIVTVDLPDQTAVAAAALTVLAVEATSFHAPWMRTRAQDYTPRLDRAARGLQLVFVLSLLVTPLLAYAQIIVPLTALIMVSVFGAFVLSEMAKWRDAVKNANVKIE
jgi:hypothetical protein